MEREIIESRAKSEGKNISEYILSRCGNNLYKAI